jgi:hypothetical protein
MIAPFWMNMIFICVLFVNHAGATETQVEPFNSWAQKVNIPGLVKDIFAKKKLDDVYEFSFNLNPFYLRGDFNGDKQNDIAILIKEKKTGKMGIAICHYKKSEVFIVGAGHAIGNGGDDFKWMHVWSVYPKSKVQSPEERTPIQLIGEGLSVEEGESASGLIYWTGKEYKWYQMTD